MNIQALLSNKISQAMILAGIDLIYNPQVRQSLKVQFGDYQVNGIISIAKKLNIPPKKLAKQIVKHLNLTGIASKIEVTDSGFINIFLNLNFLETNINKSLKSERLGIKKTKIPKTIVVDYSAPNIAKEMHLGHLRSTIIGDATVRTLEFLGHKVIRDNHIGDWGTQFGMLFAYLEKKNKRNINEMKLSDIEKIYQKAKNKYDEDKDFAKTARRYVVELQRGNEYFLKLWNELVELTISQNQIIYELLNVSLTRADIKGESTYNSFLPNIVEDLKSKGLAVESEGAVIVFLNEFRNKEGKSASVVIQKKDGGYLYPTTDIACLKYRYEILHADRIIYYIDSRQRQYLMQIWDIVRKAGYVPKAILLEHHMFGMILDKDGRPFKTRVGSTIKLSSLIYEALRRAKNLVSLKNPSIPSDELKKISKVIGIGAIKYAELSRNRIANYIFNWENMLSFDGNTAPYIQYAYTRISSIFRIAKINENILDRYRTKIVEELEAKLAVRLLQFEEILVTVARDGTPHVMCSYLYKLASTFSNFYENYPILTCNNSLIKNSRLKLALLTAKTIKLGLNILGIETVKQM